MSNKLLARRFSAQLRYATQRKNVLIGWNFVPVFFSTRSICIHTNINDNIYMHMHKCAFIRKISQAISQKQHVLRKNDQNTRKHKKNVNCYWLFWLSIGSMMIANTNIIIIIIIAKLNHDADDDDDDHHTIIILHVLLMNLLNSSASKTN